MKFNKNILYVLIPLLAFTIIFLIFISYKFNISITGSSTELSSVAESKISGVFVYEYKSPDSFIQLPENQKLKIKESWVEHDWVYNYWSKPKIVDEGVYGLNIVFHESTVLNFTYSYQWKRGRRYFDVNTNESVSNKKLSIWSKDYFNDDTLKVFITQHLVNEIYDTVSSFILLKK
jgi:hypothetical protein